MSQNGSPQAHGQQLAQLLLGCGIEQIGLVLEGFGIRLPPGVEMRFESKRFEIVIREKPILLANANEIPAPPIVQG